MWRLISLLGVLLVGTAGSPAQTLDELKARWKSGEHSGLLTQLIDYRQGVPVGSAAAQEADYMLARTLCDMDEYKSLGCEYCQGLSAMYGAYLSFEGKRIDTAIVSRACGCAPPQPPPRTPKASEDEHERLIQSLPPSPPPRPWSEILGAVAKTLLTTTTLSVQRTDLALPGDWIVGFRTVATERAPDPPFHWMVKLEVEYTYDIRHGDIIVGGWAGGTSIMSGYSYWGAVQEEPYGPSFRKGARQLQIAVQVLQPEAASTALTLFLEEGNPPNRTIITEEFPFPHAFKLP